MFMQAIPWIAAGIMAAWAGTVEYRMWKTKRSGGRVQILTNNSTGLTHIPPGQPTTPARRNIRSTIQMAMEAEEREEMNDLAEMMGTDSKK